MNDILQANRELLSRLILKSAQSETLRKVVFSKSYDDCIKKIVIEPKLISSEVTLQAETFRSDNKATHENIAVCDGERILKLTESFAQINLLTTAGDCELRISKNDKCVLIGGEALEKRLFSERSYAKIVPCANNRSKKYILDGSEEFLKLLGISDKNGRVYDKKQAKFRQINKFLEFIRDIEKHLPIDGEIRICDFCCGKSYLSFAVYHYFTVVRQRKVKMTGMDLKADVIEYCSETAKKLGFDGLEFIYGDIRGYSCEEHINLVISLHACDIATDIVLEKAVSCRADVILSTPCCHHDLNRKIDCEPLAFISAHSVLRQKFCDAATDALRLKLLEAYGYDVTAMELIDPEETPKNVLLRGIRKKSYNPQGDAEKRLMSEYLASYAFLTGGKTPEFT